MTIDSTAMHPELARLITLALDVAVSNLEQSESFLPGFFAILADGKYTPGVSGQGGAEGSNLLVIGLRQKVASEGLRAAAIYREGRMTPKGASEEVNVIHIIAELASEEAVQVFQVYRRSAAGQVMLGETETVPAPSVIFGKASPELQARMDQSERVRSGRAPEGGSSMPLSGGRVHELGRADQRDFHHDLYRLVNIALYTAKRKLAQGSATLPGSIAVRDNGQYDVVLGELSGASGSDLVTAALRQKAAAEQLRAAATYDYVRVRPRGAPEDADALHVVAELASGEAVHAYQTYRTNDAGKLVYGALQLEQAPSVLFAEAPREGARSKRWWRPWN